MPTPFPLEIVTLQRVAFRGQVERVSVIGGEGGLSIEARHAPLVTNVVAGPITVRGAAEEGDFEMAVGEGFLLVTADGASLLVDFAERPHEIDSQRAQEARERAEHWLVSEEEAADKDRAQRALARAKARLRVVNRK